MNANSSHECISKKTARKQGCRHVVSIVIGLALCFGGADELQSDVFIDLKF